MAELSQQLARVAEYEATLRRTWMTRFFSWLGPNRLFVAFYRRFGPPFDRWLMKRSKGMVATRMYGFPVLLLTTTGAKSGLRRTSPLMYARDGDDFLVVGTNFGTTHHPAWTGNLLKTPSAEVGVGGESIAVSAELLGSEEFARHWPKFTAVYGGYDRYLERLEHRSPRMFRLTPQAPAG